MVRRPLNRSIARVAALLAASLALVDQQGVALTWLRDEGSSEPSEADWGPRALTSDTRTISFTTERAATSSGEEILTRVRQAFGSVLLQAKADTRRAFFRGVGRSGQDDYVPHHRGIPLCDYHVRVSELADGRRIAFGQAPQLARGAASPSSEFPDEERAAGNVSRAWALTHGAAATWSLVDSQRCYAVYAGALTAAWRMTFLIDGLPYQAVAGADDMYALEPLFFSVDGQARVYRYSKAVSNGRELIKLPGLTGNGRLQDARSKLVVPSSVPPATEADHDFDYAESDERFAQASAFAHGQQQRLWFEGLGVEWRGTLPLEIKIHQLPRISTTKVDPNNAFYSPELPNVPASVTIADGDGKVLRDLAYDSDVVSHELGHHVIFSNLTTTKGESLVLHEGLADYFTFAHSGDPCLGDSICVQGSDACFVENTCLRAANIKFAYQDELWNALEKKLGHLHGQVISGFMWDLRTGKAFSDRADVDRLALRSVSLLGTKSGLADFVKALLTADEELFQGKQKNAIGLAAVARGLKPFLGDFVPKEPDPADDKPDPGTNDDGDGDGNKPAGGSGAPGTNGEKPSDGTQTDDSESSGNGGGTGGKKPSTSGTGTPGDSGKAGSGGKKKGGNPFGCGVVGGAQDGAGAFALALLALLPLVLPVSARSRARSR